MAQEISLYELTEEHHRIYDAIEEAGGEITPEIEEMLAINAENFVSKANGYCEIIAKYTQMANLASERIEQLQRFKRVSENSAKRMKERIAKAMEEYNLPKVEIGTHKLSFRTSQQVEIADESKIPNIYIKVETKVDKKALRNDLLNGVIVEGAELKTNKSLQIR